MSLLRCLVGLLALALLYPVNSLAIEVPLNCRVANQGARCLWSAMETAALAQGDERFRGFASRCHEWGNHREAKQKLRAMGVRYRSHGEVTYSNAAFSYYARKYGVIVGLYAGSNYFDGEPLLEDHAILLVAVTDTYVDFYDSDNRYDAQGRPTIWRSSRQWFDQSWNGSALVIFGERRATEKCIKASHAKPAR